MVKAINDKCGVATAIGVVKSIEKYSECLSGRDERNELADFQNQEPIVDNALHVASEDLKAYKILDRKWKRIADRHWLMQQWPFWFE